jgi:phosphoribosyl 1,2-cyclic phosphate phosphodiesterase
MRLTLLGTGNAAGMPWYGCDCERCTAIRKMPEQRRGPASALLELGNKKYLIDAGILDIADRFPDDGLSGIFLTHFHPDHIQGLFHLRWGKGRRVPVYCPPDSHGCADLFKHPGMLDFQAQKKFTSIQLEALRVTFLPLIHSKVTFGFVFEHQDQTVAYLTDTKGLPPKTLAWLAKVNLDLMVIDTSYPPGVEGLGHNNLDETLTLQAILKPARTVLTHIGHDFDVWLSQNTLPNTVMAAVDGKVVFSQ